MRTSDKLQYINILNGKERGEVGGGVLLHLSDISLRFHLFYFVLLHRCLSSCEINEKKTHFFQFEAKQFSLAFSLFWFGAENTSGAT
jgi:hypothetical protein